MTHYREVVDQFETDVHAVQGHVFSPTTPIDIERIYLLKREIIEMRHAVGALTPTLARLQADRVHRVPANVRGYLRCPTKHSGAAPADAGAETQESRLRWRPPAAH